LNLLNNSLAQLKTKDNSDPRRTGLLI